jgi:hypothetical protein
MGAVRGGNSGGRRRPRACRSSTVVRLEHAEAGAAGSQRAVGWTARSEREPARERVGAQLAGSRRGRAAAAATADQRLRSNSSNPSSVYHVEFDVSIPHTALHTHIILHLFTRGPLHLFIITPT